MNMRGELVRISAGFTLIELIVAMGISTILMAAVFSFMLFSSRSYRAGHASLQLQREAARAVEEMAETVRSATSIGPSEEVTQTISITTPKTTYFFGADGGVLMEAVGGAPPQRFFDDPNITVASLSFRKLTDPSSATPITIGLTIDLTLVHPAVSDPVSTSASVSLRNTSATLTPPPSATPTQPPICILGVCP